MKGMPGMGVEMQRIGVGLRGIWVGMREMRRMLGVEWKCGESGWECGE